LSSRCAWQETWRNRLSSVQVRYVTSTTICGHTQCTRDSCHGVPNRLPRGGGYASGIVFTKGGIDIRNLTIEQHAMCSFSQ
jgi:hypothetical protein